MPTRPGPSRCPRGKALWSAIDAVNGSDIPIQRRRVHKERNRLDYLSDEQKEENAALAV